MTVDQKLVLCSIIRWNLKHGKKRYWLADYTESAIEGEKGA